jgi:hypothetical protein
MSAPFFISESSGKQILDSGNVLRQARQPRPKVLNLSPAYRTNGRDYVPASRLKRFCHQINHKRVVARHVSPLALSDCS